MADSGASEGRPALHSTAISIFFVSLGVSICATAVTFVLVRRLRKQNRALQETRKSQQVRLRDAEKEFVKYKRRYLRELRDIKESERRRRKCKKEMKSEWSCSVKSAPSKKILLENCDQTRKSGSKETMLKSSSLDDTVESRQNQIAAEIVHSGAVTRRPTEQLIIDPMLPDEFIKYMDSACNVIVDYYNNPKQFSVVTVYPQDYLFDALPAESPMKPQDFNDLLKDLRDIVMPGMTHWQHPQFLAYFPSGRTFPDILGEALCASLGAVGFSYDSCPAITEMECAMVNWVGRALGIPDHFLYQGHPAKSQGGGCIMPSDADAVFCSILASRDWKVKRIMKRKDLVIADEDKKHMSKNFDVMHAISSKLVVYTSVDAHSSIERACKLAMVRCRSIQGKATNAYGITGAQLERAVLKDIKAGLIPFHVHVTLGTTAISACDELDTIWPICRKYCLWLHVDATYIGSSWIDPKYRDTMLGLVNATSLNLNLNKFLLHSTPVTMFWTQDQCAFKSAFDVCPTYLKPLHADTMDLRDWGIHLSRPFKALKIWSVFRTYGIEGLRRSYNSRIEAAAYFESLLVKHPNVKMFAKRHLALFCFQYVEPRFTMEQTNKHTRNLSIYINRSKEMFLTRAAVDGNEFIRISVNYQNVDNACIEETHEKLVKLINEFKQVKGGGIQRTPNAHDLIQGEFDVGVNNANCEEESTVSNATTWAETPVPFTMISSREGEEEPWTQCPLVEQLEKEATSVREMKLNAAAATEEKKKQKKASKKAQKQDEKPEEKQAEQQTENKADPPESDKKELKVTFKEDVKPTVETADNILKKAMEDDKKSGENNMGAPETVDKVSETPKQEEKITDAPAPVPIASLTSSPLPATDPTPPPASAPAPSAATIAAPISVPPPALVPAAPTVESVQPTDKPADGDKPPEK